MCVLVLSGELILNVRSEKYWENATMEMMMMMAMMMVVVCRLLMLGFFYKKAKSDSGHTTTKKPLLSKFKIMKISKSYRQGPRRKNAVSYNLPGTILVQTSSSTTL